MHKTKVTIGKSNLDTKQWQIEKNQDRSQNENENKRNSKKHTHTTWKESQLFIYGVSAKSNGNKM